MFSLPTRLVHDSYPVAQHLGLVQVVGSKEDGAARFATVDQVPDVPEM